MIFNNNRVRFHHVDNKESLFEYSHTHSHVNSTIENKDEKILNMLLLHWVNHNESYEEGFREWADKARNIGKEKTAINIEQAIEYMKKADQMLLEAKKNI